MPTLNPYGDPVRETTLEERMTWGTCPTCHAAHGEHCHSEIGFQLGSKAGGGRMQTGEGIHLSRLQLAPLRVKLVPA